MVTKLFKFLNNFLGMFLIGGIIGVVSVMANREIVDLDLWLHLTMGKYITLNGIIPKVDILSCFFSGGSLGKSRMAISSAALQYF